MNKPNKCKNCQWYGKPYWSIINPCDNCNKEDIEIFTHWIDPTIQEKDKEIERLNNIINTAISAINTYQDSKTLSIGYENLKRIRGILRGNDFDIQMFEEYLKELKESGNNE